MESLGKIVKFSSVGGKSKPKKNVHLHSANHLLADELCTRLNDKKHFGFYLRMAALYDHNFLRGLAGQILENQNAKTPGRLFAYLVKKHNQENKKISNNE